MQLGGGADFLRPFIWSRVTGLMRIRDGCDSECASVGKSATETMEMIRQAFGEDSIKVQCHRQQSQEHAHHFPLISRGLFTKNSSCQGTQSFPHTVVTFYGDCVETCKDSPGLWKQRKLRVLHFHSIEVIEAESQTVLNTPKAHDFQDAFKKWQKRW
jgi:hypothetical protein